MSWQLVEIKEAPTAEYVQYEAAVIAVHNEQQDALLGIEADFQAGKIDERQRRHARRVVMNQEDEKIKALQIEYSL